MYNLRVEGPHEYFANGVLVSNCAALRYVGSWLSRGGLAGFRAARDASAHGSRAPEGVFHAESERDEPDRPRRGRIGRGECDDLGFPTW